jgi:hypothetical protein
MSTIAAKLITAQPATSWKRIIRRALETLGKHYSHGPYML